MERRSVLVTCGGKWVGMVLALKQALSEVPALAGGRLIVADRDELTPAGCFADARFQVPGINDPDYIDALVELCAREGVCALVPLIDIDMRRLAPAADRFAAVGTHLVSPTVDLVDLCLDKERFHHFCVDAGLSVPRAFSGDDLDEASFPLFFRRRNGFGSIGSGRADTLEEARAALQDAELVFHEFVDAGEVSVDAYINRDGNCTVRVARVRDKVLGGEAQRSHTIDDPATLSLADATIDALAAQGLRGPLNVQMFLSDPRQLIEVNTRLGSCTVLSNAATGGRLLRSLLSECAGGTAEGDRDDYQRDLWIYRYTGDVFHAGPQPVRFSPARSEHPVEFVE